MGEYHDQEASYFGDIILKGIREQKSEYKQIFSNQITRTADWDWPRPDYVCFDEKTNCTYALEYKPPYQSKREYLCGLGQSLSYLQKHAYSGLIVPNISDDGFEIAKYICNTLDSPEFSNISTSLFSYNIINHEIKLLHPITKERKDIPVIKEQSDTQTFWCYWRDISHFELFDLLDLSFKYSNMLGDIYTNHIFPEFYAKLINKKTKQWNGKPRNKTDSESTRKAEKQNYKIPLERLGLWTASEGRLTDLGYKLYEVGKKYGPNSQLFIYKLTYLILINGKHLDLIHLFNNFQRKENIPNKSDNFLIQIEKYLGDNGFIGKRKPTARTTGAKHTFIRDEPKLWNKLGLLESKSSSQYFYPNFGYRFNWEKITEILVNGIIK